MPTDRLEQRMTGRDPFEAILLGGLAVGRATWILHRQCGKLPVWLSFVMLKDRWRPGRLKGMRHVLHDLELERDIVGGLADEAGDGLGHNATLLRPSPALDQHLQVEFLGCQTLERVLADGPEVTFVHVFEQSFFEVCISQLSGVIIPKNPLDVSGGKDFTNNIENRVVVESVADFLELLQQPLEDPAFNGIRGHEVEDEAVLPLAVTMDATHALLKAIRVPWNVVIEKDIADLQVDAFSGRLGSDEHLDRALAKLLLRVEARARLVAGA